MLSRNCAGMDTCDSRIVLVPKPQLTATAVLQLAFRVWNGPRLGRSPAAACLNSRGRHDLACSDTFDANTRRGWAPPQPRSVPDPRIFIGEKT
jgi:hypothetical protein